MSDDRPEPDRIQGAPHPRETLRLIGQEKAEADFLAAYNSGRLHSGWLVTGPKGVGKATLAYRIAAFLLAEGPQDAGGGLFGEDPTKPETLDLSPDHPDRRLILAGSHPRLAVIRRAVNEKTGRLQADITAEPVRDLKKFFHMSAADGGRRVVIVDAADEMNVTAANSILKELEEPPARTTILLVAHQPARLLPTIRSRCRELRCVPLQAEEMAAAMDQAGVHVDEREAMTALTGGSVGEGVRLAMHDGLALYAELIALLSRLPHIDRPTVLALAESCTGKGAEIRFPLVIDLLDQFIARTARAGLLGEPDRQGAPGEARLIGRIAPDDRAARRWATLQQDLGARIRHGRAVNLDPAALILDMLFKIEEVAQGVTAA
jgi:DNA polymerase-3 subunit delta'